MLTEEFIKRIPDCEREPYLVLYRVVDSVLKKTIYYNDMWGIVNGEKTSFGNNRKEYFDVMYSIFYTPCLDKMLQRLRWWWLHRPEYFTYVDDSGRLILTWDILIDTAFPKRICPICLKTWDKTKEEHTHEEVEE